MSSLLRVCALLVSMLVSPLSAEASLDARIKALGAKLDKLSDGTPTVNEPHNDMKGPRSGSVRLHEIYVV